MDVKSAFLNGVIKEEVFVRQPTSFENPKYPNRVYELLKALYGLQQVSRDDIIFSGSSHALVSRF
jgi:hypothetical protein